MMTLCFCCADWLAFDDEGREISEPQGKRRRSSGRSCFVIGTDVGVRKTLVASALMYLLHQHGIHTVDMESVAAGATLV
jgi:hypothetical protein